RLAAVLRTWALCASPLLTSMTTRGRSRGPRKRRANLIPVSIEWTSGAPRLPRLGRERPFYPAVKALLVSLYFPPAGGGGVQRTLKTATHLPALGIETHVLAPDDPKWVHRDDELEPPTQAWVHRARYIGPRGRRPAHELHGRAGL